MINLRNKGIKHQYGKIIKGCIRDATTKLSIGSIPASYESIIYRSQSQQGFGSAQARFAKNNDTNVINTQKMLNSHANSPQKINASYSQAGYGPFLSKVKRNQPKYSQTPGVGSYTIGINLEKKQQRSCKTQKRHRFIKVEKIKKQQKNYESPGPGYYSIDKCNENKKRGWKSSFITQVNRNSYIPHSQSPGPTYYHKDNSLEPKVQIPSKHQKQNQVINSTIILKNIINKDFKTQQYPSPTAYDQSIPNYKPFYQKIKISGNFISGSKDRFGNNEDKSIQTIVQYQTSPFSYSIKSTFDKLKDLKLIDSPFFMSETKREIFQASKYRLGPNYQKTQNIDRKLFHFNIRKNWI